MPHRLEVLRQLNDVTYVNDSIATAPERVIAALRSYDEPLILLLGGKDKNLPWEEMLLLALQKAAILSPLGMSASRSSRRLSSWPAAMRRSRGSKPWPEALEQAVKLAQAGDVVLLSPGGTSYDAYVDFVERGEHFRQLVMQL